MDPYLEWLANVIGEEITDSNYILFRTLHSIAYFWEYPLDEAREKEGYILRQEYDEMFHPSDDEWEMWLMGPASVLEVLIMLCRRWYDQIIDTDNYPNVTCTSLFWEILSNIGLSKTTDYDEPDYIELVTFKWMSHEYSYDGKNGSLFPLVTPPTACRMVDPTKENGDAVVFIDMRKESLWMQCNFYTTENYPIIW